MRNFILLLLVLLGAAQAQQFTVVYRMTCVAHRLDFEKSKDWCNQDLAHAVTFNIGAHGDVLDMPVDASNCGTFGKLTGGPDLFVSVRIGQDFTDQLGNVYQVLHTTDKNGTPVMIRVDKNGNAATQLVYPTFSVIYTRPR